MIRWYIDPGTGFTIFGIGAWAAAFVFGFFTALLFLSRKIFGFFKRHKILILIIIAGLILSGLILKGVFMASQTIKFDKRVVVLGFDALSPEILEPMMEEGALPNFKRLKETGSYRRLATTNPPQSPVAWSGFATGQNPAKNGIFDFITRDPRTYRLDLALSRMKWGRPVRALKSKCFWQHTSEARVPAAIITCPVTYPPDKIYGRMLSGMGVPDILGTEGTFTFYTSESLERAKFIGGKVFQVKKSDVMVMYLIGPRIAKFSGKAENTRIPFKVTLKGKDSIGVEYLKNKLELKTGKWSDWCEVEFKVGLFRKAKGIFKFYLVSVEPELKLYISPVNFDPHAPLFKISYPGNYSSELADAVGLYHTQGMPVDTWAVNEGRLSEKQLLEQVQETFKEKKAMLDYELHNFKRGVLFCYFDQADIVQHMFWRYIDTTHPLYEKDAPQEYKTQIQKWYKHLNDVLGDVLGRLKPEDTLIVLSDHGFGTFRRAAHLNSWLKENGYLFLKNPYAEEGAELLADIDWTKTRAYAIGFGAIYINQKNRERSGIVELGRETQALKAEIAGKLEKWVDEKYSQAVVRKVYKREEIFSGRYADETPDLYVGFNKGYRASWQTAMGGVPAGLLEDNLRKWSGDHLFDPALVPGVVFSNKKIIKENPSIYDVAPTILKITGYKEGDLNKCGFDGSPLM